MMQKELLSSVVVIIGAARNTWEGIRSNQGRKKKLEIVTCNQSLSNPLFSNLQSEYLVSWF